MKAHLYIALVFSLMLSACFNTAVPTSEGEQLAINQLILLRTEGLILAEMVHERTERDEIRKMCKKIIAYYQDTHPGFLEICENRIIAVQSKDFDSLWNKTNDFMDTSGYDMEETFINLYQNNIERSITLYEVIIQSNDWEDISYFSFLALPHLYNQQQELRALENENNLKVDIDTHPCVSINNSLTNN